jgi:CBS domain-containing protein
MQARQIMTPDVITVTPETSVSDAATMMLDRRISGLPVVDAAGNLVGIVSEGDFLRRSELGTERKRASWLQFIVGPGRAAQDFVQERGRKVLDVMTRDPITVEPDTSVDDLVDTMERKHVKRLPVVQGGRLVGIVTRANLLRAVASLARDVPAPTASDDAIRAEIVKALRAAEWCPIGLQVTVREGVAHLHGVITDDRSRLAAKVAAENVPGVKSVHDHLCLVDTYSGFYVESPEDAAGKS